MLTLNPIGSNQTELSANGMIVLFSYQTPVASYIDGIYYRTEQKYSKTTSKHINAWIDGNFYEVKPQDFFDNLVKKI